MANTAQAKKRARQAVKRRAHNVTLRSAMRTGIKKVRAAVESGNSDAAQAAFKETAPQIDRLARKGLIDKNAAARYKSGLNNAIRRAAV